MNQAPVICLPASLFWSMIGPNVVQLFIKRGAQKRPVAIRILLQYKIYMLLAIFAILSGEDFIY